MKFNSSEVDKHDSVSMAWVFKKQTTSKSQTKDCPKNDKKEKRDSWSNMRSRGLNLVSLKQLKKGLQE